jgi:SAM-dependent methyltransferase
MKTRMSVENPFKDNPTLGYAFEAVRDGDVILDYGCFEGEFIDRVTEFRRATCFGVDKNGQAVASYKGPNRVLVMTREIPFPAASFDLVTLLNVLEHVHDQVFLLAEIRRVLRPNGRLVITVPRRNIFSFFDLGNFKYRFPALHRAFYTHRHSARKYHFRYVDNPYGLIGDVEKEKRWHQHFREAELARLLTQAGFKVVDADGIGWFGDLINFLGLFGLSRVFTQKFRYWENSQFERRFFCWSAVLSPRELRSFRRMQNGLGKSI